MSNFPFLRKAKQSLERILGITDGREEEVPPDPNLLELLKHNPWDAEESNKFQEEVVYQYIKHHPQSVKALYNFKRLQIGTTRNYPLYRIIALGASLKTVQKVHKLFPPAMHHLSDSIRATPLHAACMYAAPLDVIQFILEKIPDAIYHANRHVYLPLHCACEATVPHPTTLEVMQLLVQTYPDALTKINRLGNTPLRAAQRNNKCRPQVLEYLMQQQEHYKDSASGTTTNTTTTTMRSVSSEHLLEQQHHDHQQQKVPSCYKLKRSMSSGSIVTPPSWFPAE